MDTIWYRNWPLWRGWKNRMTTQNRQTSNTKTKQKNTIHKCAYLKLNRNTVHSIWYTYVMGIYLLVLPSVLVVDMKNEQSCKDYSYWIDHHAIASVKFLMNKDCPKMSLLPVVSTMHQYVLKHIMFNISPKRKCLVSPVTISL